jgi:hypothetical protein
MSLDWCAVPLSNLDGNALIQTGPLLGDVPDRLRSATGASVVPDASSADSTPYRVTVPMRAMALPAAGVEGDEVTVWLDDKGRLVRAEFVISQPIAGFDDPAIGHVRWVLSDLGDAKVEVVARSDDEVEHFPDCSI